MAWDDVLLLFTYFLFTTLAKIVLTSILVLFFFRLCLLTGTAAFIIWQIFFSFFTMTRYNLLYHPLSHKQCSTFWNCDIHFLTYFFFKWRDITCFNYHLLSLISSFLYLQSLCLVCWNVNIHSNTIFPFLISLVAQWSEFIEEL